MTFYCERMVQVALTDPATFSMRAKTISQITNGIQMMDKGNDQNVRKWGK